MIPLSLPILALGLLSLGLQEPPYQKFLSALQSRQYEAAVNILETLAHENGDIKIYSNYIKQFTFDVAALEDIRPLKRMLSVSGALVLDDSDIAELHNKAATWQHRLLLLQHGYKSKNAVVDYLNSLEPIKAGMLKLIAQASRPNTANPHEVINALGYNKDLNGSFASYVEILPILLENADINARNFLGQTALHIACSSFKPHELIKALLALDANCNVGDVDGTTPLMIATTDGNIQIIKLLLEAKADPGCKNDAGQTAGDLAQQAIEQIRFETTPEGELALRPQYAEKWRSYMEDKTIPDDDPELQRYIKDSIEANARYNKERLEKYQQIVDLLAKVNA